jgi:hypothetical protein
MTKSIDTIVKQNPPKQVPAPLLSAEEIVFTRLVAKGYTPTQAYSKAFPTSKQLAYGTRRNKAVALMTKHDIVTEIETTRETTAHLARLAEDRIEQILTEDDSQAKGSKVADVAMFMYEQANGKATQKIEQKSAHVLVTYNLGGDNAPPIPKEVLDQLN